ncbi:hypothetical protein U4E84_10435 [Halorubrum sp. AD140]|uniref:hypothetical protein n=1 Tax=Halorubrum sp. AD140 TaxID=3050073 RepID=UPI002ACCD934|nr:hypothetical protein [Halorubrum sp. AD140]MDZ5811756.1 hypothetical protein [Halorubrum sp. AD140]
MLEDDFSRFEPYRGSRKEDGRDLTDQIDITGVARTADGIDINEGVAARETLATRESAAIEFDEISVDQEMDVVTRHTEFAGIPGEVVVVANTSGLFFYDVLQRAISVTPERAQIDLDGVLSEFSDPSLWKVGFYDRDAGAENGVIHGTELQADPAFSNHLTSGAKNQLGMRVSLDGTEYNLNITESGYFEIYEPRDLETKAFLQFIVDYVAPHFSATQ